MAYHPLPAGCHDAETAAQLLGMSKRALLKSMREMGWLNVGGGDNNHNLPRREFLKNGYLCTQDRGYCLKGKKEIAKSYRVMLLTQTGFNALKSELEKMRNTKTPNTIAQAPAVAPFAPVQIQPIAPPEKPFDRAAAEKERQEALEKLREWGLAS